MRQEAERDSGSKGVRLWPEDLESFWKQDRPETYAVVMSMDEQEGWVLDETPPLSEPYFQLAAITPIERLRRADHYDVFNVLGYSRSSRALRFMSWVAEHDIQLLMSWVSTAFEVLNAPAQESAELDPEVDHTVRMANLLLARCLSAERRRMVAVSFSESAIRQVKWAIEIERAMMGNIDQEFRHENP